MYMHVSRAKRRMQHHVAPYHAGVYCSKNRLCENPQVEKFKGFPLSGGRRSPLAERNQLGWSSMFRNLTLRVGPKGVARWSQKTMVWFWSTSPGVYRLQSRFDRSHPLPGNPLAHLYPKP